MEDNKLALELLHEVKKTSKRYFILFIITLALMFISNAILVYPKMRLMNLKIL